MKFTKATPETILPNNTWFICELNGIRQPMRYEREMTWNVWWELSGNAYLDNEHDIYFLNDLENVEP